MGSCAGKSGQSKYCIQVKAKIWDKETPNLYDFESEQIIKKNFILKERESTDLQQCRFLTNSNTMPINIQMIIILCFGYCYVKEIYILQIYTRISYFSYQVVSFGQDLFPLPQAEYIKDQIKIFDIQTDNGLYVIKPYNQTYDYSLWRVIREEPQLCNQPTWTLKKGDTIKFGRILLNVEDFSNIGNSNQNQDNSNKNKDGEEGINATDQSQQIEDRQYQCKICLAEAATQDNPLLSACSCSGSLKYCHLQCLKQWVSSQGKTKVFGNTKIFSYKNLICELCKCEYKTQFKYQNNEYNILEIKKPSNPYIILRQINPNSNDHYLYLVDLLNSDTCDIGRIYDCHVRLNDISVSRNHASLTFSGNKLILKDNKSKFGTLVQIKEPLNLHSLKEKKIVLQTGKAIMKIEIKKKSSLKNISYLPIPPHIEVCKALSCEVTKRENENITARDNQQNENDVIIYDVVDIQLQDNISIGKEKKFQKQQFNSQSQFNSGIHQTQQTGIVNPLQN